MSEEAKESSVVKTLINTCPHRDRAHYSLGLCRNCYTRENRKKKANEPTDHNPKATCPHPDRNMFYNGMCK